MTIDERISAFGILGKFMLQFSSEPFSENHELIKLNGKFAVRFEDRMHEAKIQNPWFTDEFIRLSLLSLGRMLDTQNLEKWIAMYPGIRQKTNPAKNVGLIMAGNIPLVGFHDFLTALISGNRVIAKLSSKDDQLFPVIKDLLIEIQPAFNELIKFTDGPLEGQEAIIATGSNNSSRYFEYYFGKYPHIIRKNRNSSAILSGDESDEELQKLADDIFSYFGLGCRNVSKLFIHENFDINRLFQNFSGYEELYQHTKYANNHDYYKSIYLLNRETFLDNGFVLLKEDQAYGSPVGCLYFEKYRSITQLKERLSFDKNLLQCVVSKYNVLPGNVEFGETQYPELWNYADNVDTMKFLINLS